MIVKESLVGVPRPFLALFLTLHDPYWGIPNWPVLRPAPKYTTGLHPKPNRCATFPFHTEMSKFLEVKGPSNDFDIRRETEKWATIQRNYCRKISIPDCEQWKLSPFWISHCIPTLTVIYCDSKTRPPFRQVDKANRQPTDVFFWKMKLPFWYSLRTKLDPNPLPLLPHILGWHFTIGDMRILTKNERWHLLAPEKV